MKDITQGIDVRKIPLSEFPDPPEGYHWEIDDHHLSLTVPEEDYFWVRYDVPGGYITSHAEKEVVAFFVDALREVTSKIMSDGKTIPSGPPTEVSEESESGEDEREKEYRDLIAKLGWSSLWEWFENWARGIKAEYERAATHPGVVPINEECGRIADHLQLVLDHNLSSFLVYEDEMRKDLLAIEKYEEKLPADVAYFLNPHSVLNLLSDLKRFEPYLR